METTFIIIIPIILYIIMIILKQERVNDKFSGNTTKIDDDNFIINGELVSFEKDTPLLRFQQEQEDSRIYSCYERNRLSDDREYLGGVFFKTTAFIRDYPEIINKEFTYLTKEEVLDSYDKYLLKCKKLEEICVLDMEEFIIHKNNIIHCSPIGLKHHDLQMYTIYNPETAKYSNNMDELLEEEFKNKWY